MNINFPNIVPNRGVDGVKLSGSAPTDKIAESGVKPLFGEALTVEEREILSLDGTEDIDMEDIEKELVRDDKLGKLVSSQLNWQPPDMPNFV